MWFETGSRTKRRKRMLEIRVGDQARECDPRFGHPVKDIVAVTDEYVTLKRGNRETRVKRAMFHENAEKKKGYLLIKKAARASLDATASG
jgi:hypothetical protein